MDHKRLDNELEWHLAKCSRLENLENRDPSARLTYIVGYTSLGQRLLSFEEASEWARRQGHAYSEVNLDTGLGVPEVFTRLVKEMKYREPAVAKASK